MTVLDRSFLVLRQFKIFDKEIIFQEKKNDENKIEKKIEESKKKEKIFFSFGGSIDKLEDKKILEKLEKKINEVYKNKSVR
jgi:predicted patatin/cPLA2 family phospholipase